MPKEIKEAGCNYIDYIYKEQQLTEINWHEWRDLNPDSELGQNRQTDSDQCGIFVCLYLDYIVRYNFVIKGLCV